MPPRALAVTDDDFNALKDLVIKYANTDSSEIIARTMEAVNQWTGAGELQDDMTMVVARRL